MIKPKEIESLLTHRRLVFEVSIFHLVWGFLLWVLPVWFLFGLLGFFKEKSFNSPVQFQSTKLITSFTDILE